jgi:putative nucleotidyltransferase with HDIG domain
MQPKSTDRTKNIRIAQIVAALSQALDITEGQPKGHAARSCWIAISIGEALGLSSAEMSDLYYAALLKDLGCSSNAARVCAHYITDDLVLKREFKKLDGSLPKVLAFVLTHSGMEASMAEKFRSIVSTLRDGKEIVREIIDTRCQRGAEIARQLWFSEVVAQTILSLDEHWDGSGNPQKLKEKQIPRFSQIALLAQVVDVFFTGEGRETATNEIAARRGTWFDPELVDVFKKVAASEEFWRVLADENLPDKIHTFEPVQFQRIADEDFLDAVAQGFSQVVDSKSPFTAGHSDRVMIFADLIAEELGFNAEDRRWLRRAALLHDIGKLGISNAILDKPDRLTDDEFEKIKMHPIFSAEILGKVDAFSDMVHVAGGHHERLDGKGYPNGLKGEEIDLDTRIVTVADIFDALTADRPYREAMPTSKAMSILDEMTGAAVDERCVTALKTAIAKLERLPQSSEEKLARVG